MAQTSIKQVIFLNILAYEDINPSAENNQQPLFSLDQLKELTDVPSYHYTPPFNQRNIYNKIKTI